MAFHEDDGPLFGAAKRGTIKTAATAMARRAGKAALLALLVAVLGAMAASLAPGSTTAVEAGLAAPTILRRSEPESCGFYKETALPADAVRIAADNDGASFLVDYVGRNQSKMLQTTR